MDELDSKESVFSLLFVEVIHYKKHLHTKKKLNSIQIAVFFSYEYLI